jgi:hypothetical protein
VRQVGGLAGSAVVAVAEEEREVAVLGDMLHPLGDVGEERVGGVEHDVADRAAAARAELAGRLVAHEPEIGHRLLDPRPSGSADAVGLVEDVGHRAQGHPGP